MTSSLQVDSHSRRWSVYFLLDVNGSLSGPPIHAMEQGVQLLANELMNLAQDMVRSVDISVITFGTSARMVLPLTPLDRFVAPQLYADGLCALGAAMRLLGQVLDHAISSGRVSGIGRTRPLVILLMSGEPTDSWQTQMHELNSQQRQYRPLIWALGAGNQFDSSDLRAITPNTIPVGDLTSDRIRAMFMDWVGESLDNQSTFHCNGKP